MVPAITNALSGYKAATERLSVSAENIANQFSTSRVENGKVTNEPYVPQRVEAISQAEGGVTTERVAKEPASVPRLNSSTGELENVPNVNLEEEIVNQVIASYDAKANLRSIQIQNELFKSALDIFT